MLMSFLKLKPTQDKSSDGKIQTLDTSGFRDTQHIPIYSLIQIINKKHNTSIPKIPGINK